MKVMVSEGTVRGQLAAGISAATRINENFYVYISTLKSKSVIWMDRGIYMFQARSGNDCAVLAMLRDVEHVERCWACVERVERCWACVECVARCWALLSVCWGCWAVLRVLTSVDYFGRFIWLLRSWVGASARLCIFLIRPSSLFVGFCAFKSTVGVSPNELKM